MIKLTGIADSVKHMKVQGGFKVVIDVTEDQKEAVKEFTSLAYDKQQVVVVIEPYADKQ